MAHAATNQVGGKPQSDTRSRLQEMFAEFDSIMVSIRENREEIKRLERETRVTFESLDATLKRLAAS